MTEHHHHHHTPCADTSTKKVLVFSVILNLSFVLMEALVGLTHGSLSLLSDAGHNLSDVLSLLLVLLGFRLAQIYANDHYTYGYKKSTILISLLNAVILLVAVGAIVAESIHKFASPTPVDGLAIGWTAGVGIVINGLTAFLLMHGQKKDLNVRGAFLHMVADTLVSVGVVVSGVIIHFTGWMLVDPLMSIAVAVAILFSTWGMLKDSLRLSLDGIPEGIDLEEIKKLMMTVDGIRNVHHLHIWAISTTENAITAHVVIHDLEQMETIKSELKHLLAEHNIPHCTLEFETEDHMCPCQGCDGKHCENKATCEL